jgi:hypothetical protein
MSSKNKLKTPEWILEGYDSPEAYAKARGKKTEKKRENIFKVRECPKCHSDDVGVVLSGSNEEENSSTGKEWECRKCKWHGKNISEKELAEDEFIKYMEKKNE